MAVKPRNQLGLPRSSFGSHLAHQVVIDLSRPSRNERLPRSRNRVAEESACDSASMEEAKQLHARALRRGVRRLQPLLLRVLAAGDLRYAALLLESYPSLSPPSAPLYNRLLHALASLRHPLLLPLFSRVHRLRILTPLSFTLLFSASTTAAPSSSSSSSSPTRFALCSHALLIKSGHFASSGDPFLASALVSFYAKNSHLDEAMRVFEEIPCRDAAVYNSLLSAYTKCGQIDTAEKLFEEMPDRNVVSWTAMVSAYAQNGRHEKAVETFMEMWERAGVHPNELTISSVLPACAAVGAMELGRKVEEYARVNGLLKNVYVANALVEMYAKCGCIRQAWEVFQGIGRQRDLCSWNSMIMAFAVHGLWREALSLFHKLRGLNQTVLRLSESFWHVHMEAWLMKASCSSTQC